MGINTVSLGYEKSANYGNGINIDGVEVFSQKKKTFLNENFFFYLFLPSILKILTFFQNNFIFPNKLFILQFFSYR